MPCAAPQTSPVDLIVNTGDEIRWVKQRTLPVQLDLVGDVQDEMSCERGFSNFIEMKRESAVTDPNDSVAAFFSGVGVITNRLRMGSAFTPVHTCAWLILEIGTGGPTLISHVSARLKVEFDPERYLRPAVVATEQY